MDSVFRLMNTKEIIFLSFLAAGFCRKNLAFASKIMVWRDSTGGYSPLCRGLYVYENGYDLQQSLA